jgi:hypothetical protein
LGALAVPLLNKLIENPQIVPHIGLSTLLLTAGTIGASMIVNSSSYLGNMCKSIEPIVQNINMTNISFGLALVMLHISKILIANKSAFDTINWISLLTQIIQYVIFVNKNIDVLSVMSVSYQSIVIMTFFILSSYYYL